MIGPAKAARTGSFLLPVLALAAVLALSGCGGGDDSSSATQTTTGTAEAENGSGANKQDSGKEQDGGKEQSAGQGNQGNGSAPGDAQPEGEREPGITPQQKREATTANITLEIPVLTGGKRVSVQELPAKYTCDGEDTWPALRWSGLPPEAEELVLMILSVHPEEQKLLFDWAVAGLDPSLSSIEEGELPAGAVVGENSFGERDYHACPPKGQLENYIFLLFAIPDALDPQPGFDARELRKEVLAQHGNVGLQSGSYER